MTLSALVKKDCCMYATRSCCPLVTCMHTVALRVISSARLYLAVWASNPRYAVGAGVLAVAEWLALGRIVASQRPRPLSRARSGVALYRISSRATAPWSQDVLRFQIPSALVILDCLLDPTPRTEGLLTPNIQHEIITSPLRSVANLERGSAKCGLKLRDFAIQGSWVSCQRDPTWAALCSRPLFLPRLSSHAPSYLPQVRLGWSACSDTVDSSTPLPSHEKV